ncbi:glycosyltransferase family 4 protein [Dactylosporangium sp. NPDC000244]|uniref:glycosyltransferase family 4 protein n=1 Tax=Dactylosporangium sp. NPDC000244 TaxID=3154365 RepID=UPI003317349C
MRIALIAPPWFAVPPRTHGGIETHLALLARELDRRGHEVGLFAAGSSTAPVPVHALYAQEQEEHLHGSRHSVVEARHVQHAYEAIGRDRYDVIHDNAGLLSGGIVGAVLNERGPRRPILRTVHQGVDAATRPVYDILNGFGHLWFNAISEHQRALLRGLKVCATIANAVDPQDHTYRETKDKYLAFLGRLVPDKGVHIAIEVARRTGLPLRIAGRADRAGAGLRYFEERIRPELDGQVEYIGEIGPAQRNEFLSRARALLFPAQWAEPFGLVAIEALACGTPVIASDRGALPEIVEPGRSGFLAADADAMSEAVARLDTLRPADCLQRVRDHFTPGRMTDRYVRVYESLLDTAA